MDPGETQEDRQKRIAGYIETKRYLDEPEVLPWYRKDLTEIRPHTRELFENYCHIAPAEVEAHIKKIRDQAFKIFPYPCVGNWGFLNLSILDSPVYNEVLDRIKNGEQYLDLGCCMGQDIRKLSHSGAPQENLHGSDLKKEFWDIGYDLFLDKSTLKTKFIAADILDADSGLKELDGKLNLVHAASFFHLFDLDDQVKVAKRVVKLLKAEPGSMVFGRQGGLPVAGKLSHGFAGVHAYWHNPESWAKLWKQVGDETGSEWKVESKFGDEGFTKSLNGHSIVPEGTRFLTYTVRRL